MAKSSSFNRSQLTRENLYSYFYSVNRELVGKTLPIDQIHRILSRHIKKAFPIKIKKYIDPKIQKGYIYVGGMYYSGPDRKHQKAIELNLSYHPENQTLKLSEFRIRRIAIRCADTLLHEMIHMRQYRARRFKDIPGYQSTAASAKLRKDQEYYGDRDEMGAFAFNLACELIDRFGYSPTEIKRYLDSNRAKKSKNCWWYSYMKAFNWNHNHRIIRRMKKKVMNQLSNACQGKPFRTNDWLTS